MLVPDGTRYIFLNNDDGDNNNNNNNNNDNNNNYHYNKLCRIPHLVTWEQDMRWASDEGRGAYWFQEETGCQSVKSGMQ